MSKSILLFGNKSYEIYTKSAMLCNFRFLHIFEAEMTQHNAQSTSEQAISENDLIAQRHAKLEHIPFKDGVLGSSPRRITNKKAFQTESLSSFYNYIVYSQMLKIGSRTNSGFKHKFCITCIGRI